jgi:hypothetical protein
LIPNSASYPSPKDSQQKLPKASYLIQRAVLAAKVLDTLPFNLAGAAPTRLAWKIRPYLGVLCLVLMALKRAFSAPKIYTVEAGYLAKFTSEPAWAINLAPTNSPTIVVRFGAIAYILFFKYSES